MDYKDYYAILGITREADSEEVKRAYRKMARIYHPDVNPDKATATERFKDINEAYTVLSDHDKRRRYDQINTSYEQMRRASARPASTAGQSRASSASYTYSSSSSYSSSAAGSSTKRAADAAGSRTTARGKANSGPRRPNTGTISEEDMERIFRGFGWAYSTARGQRTASSTDFSDFFDAVFGGFWGRSEEDANSTEFRPGRDLQAEAALTLEEAFSGAFRTVSLSDGRKVEINIPPGVATGSKLRVRDQGVRTFGRPRGHLYVNIDVKPHPQFTRTGDDLRVKVSVPYHVAQKSGEVKVPGLDRTVVLKIPAGTQSGQVLRLKGLGMPRLTPDKLRGDLLVEVTVLPAPPPKSGSARPATRKSANVSARVGVWLRKILGFTLLAIGLTAFVAVALSAGVAGWQVAAAVGAVLVAHGLATRSWLTAPGVVAVGASLGYAGWSGAEVADVTQSILPLLPLALGYYLLAYRPTA